MAAAHGKDQGGIEGISTPKSSKEGPGKQEDSHQSDICMNR